MKLKIATLLICFIFIGMPCINGAQAYDLPAVNLGVTSFVDGGLPAGPGLYVIETLQYFTSNEFKDSDGNNSFPSSVDEDLDVWVSFTQFAYLTNQDLFPGAKWSMNFIIPIIYLDMDYDRGNKMYPQDNSGGLGDILVGPFLQWDPVMGKNGPLFVHRIELQMLFPTGKYDKENNDA